jgi:DNA-directed RNA polymerase specialized sigma24 family protein
MSSSGSVTHWIELLQTGDDEAAGKLWERYFRRLVGLARVKLEQRGAARRVADEEDVALSVFDSFCRGLDEGRFPNLQDRDNLWKVLVMLTARKALRLVQHERRQKRGGGNVLAEADVPTGNETRALLDDVVGREPSPEFTAQVAEECSRLLNMPGDDTLRAVARGKMEGDTNAEIAVKLGCLERTVERKLRTIRDCWEKNA